MDVMPTVASDQSRAAAYGIAIRVSEEQDRVPADRRNPAVACPTCDDGIRTITHPVRCAACVEEGL